MNAPSTDALEAARLVDRLERLARLDATPDPLNAAQWEALRYLARANRYSRTPAAVADYLASTRGTVSRTLAALEDKGYLQREDNPRDGRSVDFALTARGRKRVVYLVSGIIVTSLAVLLVFQFMQDFGTATSRSIY